MNKVHPIQEMPIVFRLTPAACERAGFLLEFDSDGSVNVRAPISHEQIFDAEWMRGITGEWGDRETDRILDMACAVIRREDVMLRLRKAMTE